MAHNYPLNAIELPQVVVIGCIGAVLFGMY